MTVTSPQLSVAPQVLDFGFVQIGQADTLEVAVTNAGTDTLVVTGVTVTRSDYAVTPTHFVLAPGGSAELSVVFAPPVIGIRNAMLSFHSNDPDGSPQVQLLGKGRRNFPIEQAPARFALSPVVPNPFRGEVSLGFELPAASAVKLFICDAAGRVVRDLVEGDLPPGRHVVRWDGRDDANRQVAAGLYFSRFQAGAFRRTERMVLLK
jgi:hypothetical protein